MSPFPRFLKSTTVIGALCAVAMTTLVPGHARLSALASAELSALPESFQEATFLEAFGDMSEEEIAEYLAKWQDEFTYTKVGGLDAKNKYCERFLSEDGSYGEYGKVINAFLKEKYADNPSTPMLADDLVGMETKPGICPNWRKFDTELRIKFWVWTFAAISSLEASCGVDKRAMNPKGVNGVGGLHAVGLLQLELESDPRKRRPTPACHVTQKRISRNNADNLRCGVDIMEWLVSDGPGKHGPSPIYRGKNMSETSYWEKLRRLDGGPIGRLIRQFKPCRGEMPKPPAPPKGVLGPIDPTSDENSWGWPYQIPAVRNYSGPLRLNDDQNTDQEQLLLEQEFYLQKNY